MTGSKDDDGKARYDLVPADALSQVVDVLTHGAAKYSDDNWRRVPDWKRRYYAAAQRHLNRYWMGETIDPESGCHHLAHAICCALFILEKETGHDE